MSSYDPIDCFIRCARKVCEEIERFAPMRRDELLSSLIDLLSAANLLTGQRLEVPPQDFDIENEGVSQLINIPNDIWFYEVFNPLDGQSVRARSLRDSLGDVYSSLKAGLLVLDRDAEMKSNVLWELKNDFEYHWGRDLIDVIRFLMLSK